MYAAEGGRERARRARLSPAERARELFTDASPRLSKELVDAALGQGQWKGEQSVQCPECSHEFTVEVPKLKPGEQLTAVQHALSQGIGRPGTTKPKVEEPEEEAPPGLEVN